jgi:hypothetical protein
MEIQEVVKAKYGQASLRLANGQARAVERRRIRSPAIFYDAVQRVARSRRAQ